MLVKPRSLNQLLFLILAMKFLLRPLLVCAFLLTHAAVVRASQVRVPINSATSTLNLELCANPGGLGTDCDDDTKPLGGHLTVGLNENGNPSSIALRDFDLQGIGTFNLNLSWLFGLARVDATATNLRIYHGRPGGSNAPVPVVNGAYTFTQVPSRTAGTASYVINPTACGAVTIPCSSNINLSALSETTIESVAGTLAVANGVLTLALDLTFFAPFDETNPDLGTFRGHAIIRGSAPVSLALIPPQSDWRFLDNGGEAPINWNAPGFLFDDSGWASGPAQLGYGDGDENFVVSFGPDPANKFITTYFRRTLFIEDPSLYTNLALRVLRDDGVVVYLNGAEVWRDNLPEGAPNHLTPALVSINGSAENLFYVALAGVAPGLLHYGENTIAVEVHQQSASSSDLSFDLELIGNTVFSNAPPLVVITSPVSGANFTTGAVNITVTAADADGLVTALELFADGVKLASLPLAGGTFSWVGVCAGPHVLEARATDNSSAVAVSAPVNITVTGPPLPLVAAGARWKYLDTGANLGTTWRALNFNDAAWASGPAQLGFGDGDEGTVVNGGPSTNRFITTYFRHAFVVANPTTVGALTLRLLRDDGAVVYLNGTEVVRNNLPTGAVTFSTLAVTNAGAADELNNFYASAVSPALLRAGTNVIAVEVHQAAINSSDLSFDLALDAGLFMGQEPLLFIERFGAQVRLRWAVAYSGCYQLQSNPNLGQPGGWTNLPNTPVSDGTWQSVTLDAAGAARFFRLRR